MKKIIYVSLLFFFAGFTAHGQSEMIIEPGAPGVINAAIEADTLANGERADPDRVYVLRRGFPYLLTGGISFADYHLRIKAEDGDGERPFIIVDSGAEPISQIFRTNGDASLTLDGLHISGQDLLGAYNSRIIRINSDNAAITINDCVLEEAGQAVIRIQGDNPVIKLTNSVFRNAGRPFNPDNGRLFDNRGVPIDTLWVENSIIYNVTSRIYRSGGGSSIDLARFNQNTIWGSGQHGINLGETSNLEFTNNIYFNGIFLGDDAAAQDTLADAEFWITVDTFDAAVNNFVVSHNNFHWDQELIDAFPIVAPDGDTIISVEDFVLDLNIQDAVILGGTIASNIDEDLDFGNAPEIPFQFITVSAMDTVELAEQWDMSDLTSDADLSLLGAGITRYRAVHDFSYPTSATSYTAGTNGQPLGTTIAFPTSIPDIFVENRILYYPNPTTNFLYIQNLEKVELENVRIFNLAGQQLQEFRSVNNAILEINTSNLTNGTYILSIVDKAGNISSRKFLKQ